MARFHAYLVVEHIAIIAEKENSIGFFLFDRLHGSGDSLLLPAGGVQIGEQRQPDGAAFL